MAMQTVTVLSPLPVYLDETGSGSGLAARPATLEGKVVGLLPNWRPSAVELLKVIGALLQERCHPEAVVMEQAVTEVPMGTGKLLDSMHGKLDDLARRVDVVITATGY